ncbi:1,2-dihydroxy-3-keto-5-methylthiopentene dioxygenase [Naasia lichenicola]|uniref:Acireductone dioxygenase n=1 Tax=Naasia lichenicola TaxID=2565933 RepID=A0A4S4FNN4_9MICO|nr:cupin [Naasia lichenicola]THG31864.1 cupin [Naasia lichenicola]
MTLLTVWDETDPGTVVLETTDAEKIRETLAGLGARFLRWDLKEIPEGAGQDDVLALYRSEIDGVLESEGYTLVDVIELKRGEGPEWQEQVTVSRNKFLSEHQHDDDEDRFFAKGSGVFYLRALGKVHAVFCEAGDVISVPANTTHWFDMGTNPEYVSVRFFHDDDGWVGHFTGSTIAEGFASYDELADRRLALA